MRLLLLLAGHPRSYTGIDIIIGKTKSFTMNHDMEGRPAVQG